MGQLVLAMLKLILGVYPSRPWPWREFKIVNSVLFLILAMFSMSPRLIIMADFGSFVYTWLTVPLPAQGPDAPLFSQQFLQFTAILCQSLQFIVQQPRLPRHPTPRLPRLKSDNKKEAKMSKISLSHLQSTATLYLSICCSPRNLNGLAANIPQ